MPLKVVRIGLYGAGVVGGGVVQLLQTRAPVFAARGVRFELAAVCMRDPERARDVQLPASAVRTRDPLRIVRDGSIDMVVEVMGGTDVARDVVLAAGRAGKHVVTANKALLAAHLDEIAEVFTHPAQAGPRLGYEAAVAGGVPIIRTMQSALAVDTVHRVTGIVNGTTNYILSAMSSPEGGEYGAVLKKAQEAGYAEADPSSDVGGADACNKLVLLTKLAFGRTVAPESVFTRGITSVSAFDIQFAKARGYAIKLVAHAQRRGDAIETFVCPAFVPSDSIFAHTDGVMNVVELQSDLVGGSHYHGAGAGRFPTANSVVADMLAIACGEQCAVPFPSSGAPPPRHSSDLTGKFIVRLSYRDAAQKASAMIIVNVLNEMFDAQFLDVVPDKGNAEGHLVSSVEPKTPCPVDILRHITSGSAGADVVVYPVLEDVAR